MASYQSVDVYVFDDTPAKNPVESMLVRVFDESNTSFFSQDTTDANGRVGFTLYTQTYNLRFNKFGTQVTQPQVIEVIEPAPGDPLLQEFEVLATIFQHPIATDPRLCRASGFFRDITGAPHPYLDLQFIGQFEPILLEGAGVLSERRSIRTDKDGFACIDLIRCANYQVTLQGFEDIQRTISVPDSPSVNLPDLLFPVVEEITFAEASPYSVAKGAELTLTPTVQSSDLVVLEGTANSDVMWKSSDESVFSIAITPTTIVITGQGPGTAELQAERRNNTIVRIPETPIQGVPIEVTVT